MSSAFARGVALGSLHARRRLWLLRLLATATVGMIGLATFGVRAAVQDSVSGAAPDRASGGEIIPLARSVNPASGPPRGGTPVTIRGRGLADTTAVYFGNRMAAIGKITNRKIQVTSPQHRVGVVHIRLETSAGTSPRGQGAVFAFVRSDATSQDPKGGGGGGGGSTNGGGGGGSGNADTGPVVTGMGPTSGPTSGGQDVVILGTGLDDVQSVAFGDVGATITKAGSETQVVVKSPAHVAGIVDVVVTSPTGRSLRSDAARYTYLGDAPRLKAISPARGTTEGGTEVTLKGDGLGEANGVSIGGVQVNATPNEDGTELTINTPPHDQGPVDVVVNSPNGPSNTRQYTYEFYEP